MLQPFSTLSFVENTLALGYQGDGLFVPEHSLCGSLRAGHDDLIAGSELYPFYLPCSNIESTPSTTTIGQ